MQKTYSIGDYLDIGMIDAVAAPNVLPYCVRLVRGLRLAIMPTAVAKTHPQIMKMIDRGGGGLLYYALKRCLHWLANNILLPAYSAAKTWAMKSVVPIVLANPSAVAAVIAIGFGILVIIYR